MNIETCNRKLAEAFLSGDMSLNEERAFIAHLDRCDSCGRNLQERAAADQRWDEVRTMLSAASASEDDLTSGDGAEALPVSAQQVLSSLAPTDDPRSLGRLDHYEIRGVIGVGAMGVVLKAVDSLLDRSVAVKVMNPSLAGCGTARQRFAREARAAAAVLHPNVIAIHSVSTAGPLPFLAMPYITGMSLQQRIERQGPLALQEILRIGSQVASGLAAAHQQGLIHRDIKPSNIMLDSGVETAVITDFGLARTIDDATMTRSGAITGTPGFMSPEQARGEVVDFRSDVFSLGSLLYILCTGHPPFRAETSFGVLRRITDEEPGSIREFNADIPRWMCRLVELLHRKNRDDRPSSGEVHQLLETCLAHTYQPDAIDLPMCLREPARLNRQKAYHLFRNPFLIGAFTMLTLFFCIAAAALLPTFPDDTLTTSSGEPPMLDVAEGEEPLRVFRTEVVHFPNPSVPGSLNIDLKRGFIEVAGSDRPEVVIEVLVRQPSAQRDTGSGVTTRFAPQYDVRTDSATNGIRFDVSKDDYVLNLRVTVPERTDLTLDTYRDGYIAVRDVTGRIDTRSQHCDIRLTDIAGTANAYSRNGNLTASFRSVATDARLDFESYNGDIRLALPSDLKATTAVSAGIGEYETDFDLVPISEPSAPELAVLKRKSGSAEYEFGAINGGGLSIRLESEQGRIGILKHR